MREVWQWRRNADRLAVPLVLLALAASGLIARVYGLDAWMLSVDDALHVSWAALPHAGDIVSKTLVSDCHPPAFYLLLHWMMACGAAATTTLTRLAAIVPGVLLVFSFYSLGASAGGRVGGITLAVVAAYSNSIVLQSQPVRHYALMLLFLSLMVSAFLSRFRYSRWLYVAFAALSLTTHYATAVVIAITGSVGAVTLWRQRKPGVSLSSVLAPWVLVHAAFGLSWWRMIRMTRTSMPTNLGYMSPAMLDSSRVLEGFRFVFGGTHLAPSGPLSFVLLVPVAWGLYALGRRRRYDIIAISIVPALLGIGLALAHLYPLVGAPRWSMWLIPTTILPVAVAFDDVRTRFGRRALSICAGVMGACFLANQAFATGSIFTPDLLRLGDEGGVHWGRTVSEDKEAVDLVHAQLEPGRFLMVGHGDWLRQSLATRFGWEQHTIHRTLMACAPPELHASDVRGCLRRSGNAGAVWVLVSLPRGRQTEAYAELVADPCLGVTRSFRTSRDALVEVSTQASRERGPQCN